MPFSGPSLASLWASWASLGLPGPPFASLASLAPSGLPGGEWRAQLVRLLMAWRRFVATATKTENCNSASFQCCTKRKRNGAAQFGMCAAARALGECSGAFRCRFLGAVFAGPISQVPAAVLCPATTWINRWHTSLMRPNLNWNLLDSSWRSCLKAGRLQEAREEGALRCQACRQEGGTGSGWGGSSWLRFQTATSEISICATRSTSFCNFDAAKNVWPLQLFPLDDSPLPNARIKIGEVGAHRASASQDDFWPRRRHAGGNRRAQKSRGKHASERDDDVSSEGGSSDVNE